MNAELLHQLYEPVDRRQRPESLFDSGQTENPSRTPLRLAARSSTPHSLRQKADTVLPFLINTPARVIAYFNHPAPVGA